jgi:hypothetical protein
MDKWPNLLLKRNTGFVVVLMFLAHYSASTHLQSQVPLRRVPVVTYDAGETLGLLPTTPLLKEYGVEVIWVPLTPWTQRLLESAKQSRVVPLPDNIHEMPHLSDRFNIGKIDYWLKQILTEHPKLVILGLVSNLQEQLAIQCKEMGIPTVGFYDSFDPASADSIVFQVARAVNEVWVPTESVKVSLRALGIKSVLVLGQPSVETWIRTATEMNPADVLRRQGISPQRRVILYAGQYGEGYKEILSSFAFQVQKETASNSNLTVVFSPHPRTDGEMERKVIADLPHSNRFMMAAPGLTTAELASIAAVVVTWTSTVGVQAVFIGKPVIYYHFSTDAFSNDLIAKGIARLATPHNFSMILKEMLAKKADASFLRQKLLDNGYVIDSDKKIVHEILKRL